MPLHFKGDKPKKKGTKRKAGSAGGDDAKEPEPADPQAWVSAETGVDLNGPTFITQPSDPQPICVAWDPVMNRVHAPSVGISSPTEEPEEEAKSGYRPRPSDVHHVWVCTKVLDSSKVTFRSAAGGFLGCDKHGVVSAEREARGPQEEWEPIARPEGMAFQSVYGGFLTVDEVAGGKMVVRGDSDTVAIGETFQVFVQAGFRRDARLGPEGKKHKKGEDGLDDEAELNKRYQAWGSGRTVLSSSDRKELRKSAKEGRIAEAMLDRRAKLKSDRYCK